MIGKSGGDVYPPLLARQSMQFYLELDTDGKHRFLAILAKNFGVDNANVTTRATQYINANAKAKGQRTVLRSEQQLREALIPLYNHFFTMINQIPNGLHFLVNMRSDILGLLNKEGTDPQLKILNDELKSLLQGWFGIGFLDLERITWSSPAIILDKIMKYEAVHAIRDWDSMKQRLGPGRLCYAFFHRSIPLEPLAFVQIALMNEIEWDVQRVLNDKKPSADPSQFKTAVFYSISSSQRGLSGVDLGNFLIKRVVREIQTLFPLVETFCTLSPIPGFRNWLGMQIRLGQGSLDGLLLEEEMTSLRALSETMSFMGEPAAFLESILNKRDWFKIEAISSLLKPILLRLCSRYLILEKKRSFALDPVANFHVRNGACVQRLNWFGDLSEKGITQSFGIMVNYVYVLPVVETNNQSYLLDGTLSILRPVSSTLLWASNQDGAKVKFVEMDGSTRSEGVKAGAKL